jgi:hypothetical protein
MCLCSSYKSKLVTVRQWIWIQIDARIYVHVPLPAVPKSRALPWHSHSCTLNIEGPETTAVIFPKQGNWPIFNVIALWSVCSVNNTFYCYR